MGGFQAGGCGIRLAFTVWKLSCEEGIVVEQGQKQTDQREAVHGLGNR